MSHSHFLRIFHIEVLLMIRKNYDQYILLLYYIFIYLLITEKNLSLFFIINKNKNKVTPLISTAPIDTPLLHDVTFAWHHSYMISLLRDIILIWYPLYEEILIFYIAYMHLLILHLSFCSFLLRVLLYRGAPPLSERKNKNFFDFLFFIDKYTLKCPISICEKKKKTMSI
jgi:hypothetical protein